MESLPTDVLVLIISHLPFKERYKVAAVSRRLYSACKAPSLNVSVDFSDRPLLEDQTFLQFCHDVNPVNIDLDGCLKISDISLNIIALLGSRLETLR